MRLFAFDKSSFLAGAAEGAPLPADGWSGLAAALCGAGAFGGVAAASPSDIGRCSFGRNALVDIMLIVEEASERLYANPSECWPRPSDISALFRLSQ